MDTFLSAHLYTHIYCLLYTALCVVLQSPYVTSWRFFRGVCIYLLSIRWVQSMDAPSFACLCVRPLIGISVCLQLLIFKTMLWFLCIHRCVSMYTCFCRIESSKGTGWIKMDLIFTFEICQQVARPKNKWLCQFTVLAVGVYVPTALSRLRITKNFNFFSNLLDESSISF